MPGNGSRPKFETRPKNAAESTASSARRDINVFACSRRVMLLQTLYVGVQMMKDTPVQYLT